MGMRAVGGLTFWAGGVWEQAAVVALEDRTLKSPEGMDRGGGGLSSKAPFQVLSQLCENSSKIDTN